MATTPTIGSNVEEIVYKNIHFLMWDIGGQESLRSSWSTYYVNTKVCLGLLCSFMIACLAFVHSGVVASTSIISLLMPCYFRR